MNDQKRHRVDRPSASLIIPTSDNLRLKGGSLELVLEFVERAMPRDVEVIVVDNSSSDSCREYAKTVTDQKGARFAFCEHKHSASHARNLGVRTARADLLIFLDDDTLIPAHSFEVILQAAHRRQFVAGAWRKYLRVDDAHRVLKRDLSFEELEAQIEGEG